MIYIFLLKNILKFIVLFIELVIISHPKNIKKNIKTNLKNIKTNIKNIKINIKNKLKKYKMNI
ncbi:hypothetical protein MarbSA_20620 [Methanobrevibacter arboriphilus]|uniref:Uncharacterized protein n=1 Tax=Methanobrevibacter arboriphilus TaxID=39441 RepID=A0ACA8R894_METAZ|nr:hypothetical protein MarbSA_20620 [Methanobrevibacter arboriphilus]